MIVKTYSSLHMSFSTLSDASHVQNFYQKYLLGLDIYGKSNLGACGISGGAHGAITISFSALGSRIPTRPYGKSTSNCKLNLNQRNRSLADC
jgi:hypothetical protein